MQILSFLLYKILSSFKIIEMINNSFFLFFLIYINVTFKFWFHNLEKYIYLTLNLTIYKKCMKIMFRRVFNITLEIHKQSNGFDFFFPASVFMTP